MRGMVCVLTRAIESAVCGKKEVVVNTLLAGQRALREEDGKDLLVPLGHN